MRKESDDGRAPPDSSPSKDNATPTPIQIAVDIHSDNLICPGGSTTRSSIGGWIGGNIKRAGYDGIVITGRADEPVRILVIDDQVSILPADDLWGVDALDTLEALSKLDGRSLHSLVIGPAGEHLSRIATIQTGTSSACGQGGFGAVMGAKKLKAISVAGTHDVKLARPGAMRDLARQITKVAAPPKWFGGDIWALNEELAREGGAARPGCGLALSPA